MTILDHVRRAWRRLFPRAPRPVTSFDPYELLRSPILEGACLRIQVCGFTHLGYVVALDRANVKIQFAVPDVFTEDATIPLRLVESVRLADVWEIGAHEDAIVAEWGEVATAMRTVGPWKRTAMNGKDSPS